MRDDDVRPDNVLQYASSRASEAVNPPPVPAVAPGLSAEQIAAIERARVLHKPLRRARTWANVDAVTLAIFAALTIPFSLTSPTGLFIGIALAACAAVEFLAIKKLERFEEVSVKMLAWNQIGLGMCLIIYAAWNLLEAHYHPERLVGEIDSSGMLTSDIKDLAQMIATCLYTSLIVIAVAVQGSSAMYYLSRGKHVQRYLAEVPEWARKI